MARLRDQIAKKHLKYTVAPDPVLKFESEDCAESPAQIRMKDVRVQHKKAQKALVGVQPRNLGSCSEGLSSFHWTSAGVVTPVQKQQCEDCWAFASAAAYEASYGIRFSASVDASEQDLVNCVQHHSCSSGGKRPDALSQFVTGEGFELDVPYVPQPDQPTSCSGKTRYAPQSGTTPANALSATPIPRAKSRAPVWRTLVRH